MYLKTPNAPGQRVFSRCAAPFFLEIRQYSCEKMSCSPRKFLAAGHIMSFQIHPKNFCAVRTIRGSSVGSSSTFYAQYKGLFVHQAQSGGSIPRLHLEVHHPRADGTWIRNPPSARFMFIGTQCDLWGGPDGTGHGKNKSREISSTYFFGFGSQRLCRWLSPMHLE